MQRHYTEQLGLYVEAKQEEQKEKLAQEAARKKREAEQKKETPPPEKPKGAKVEEVTEEEAKKIAAATTTTEAPKKVEETVPPKAGEEDDDKTPPPPGNGGKTNKYVWTQTLGDITLNIPLPPNIRTKMLDVVLATKKIKVGIKGQPLIIDGEFPEKIKVRFYTAVIADFRRRKFSMLELQF